MLKAVSDELRERIIKHLAKKIIPEDKIDAILAGKNPGQIVYLVGNYKFVRQILEDEKSIYFDWWPQRLPQRNNFKTRLKARKSLFLDELAKSS